MVGGLLGLLLARAMVSSSPTVIALQVVALLIFAWARLTFGRRSYHVAANPTEGGLVTSGPYRYALAAPWTKLFELTASEDGAASQFVPTDTPSLLMRVEEID